MRNEFNGTWHNQYGSTVVLEGGSDGRLAGRVTTAGGESFAIVGVVHGDLASFAVDWGRHGAVTSWVGHLYGGADGPIIDALWHMAVQIPHPERPDERWRSVLSGADVFRRGPAPKTAAKQRYAGPQPLWLL